MDATLKDLADLLVKAIPTIVFFVFLTFYLRSVLFTPISQILEERRRQTEGVRDLAQRAFEEADKKTSEFERAMQLARADISKENDALRRQWSEEQMKAIAQARSEAEQRVAEAKKEIAEEVEKAKAELDLSVDRLGSQIVDALMKRRAA